jgi:hypothetical protein
MSAARAHHIGWSASRGSGAHSKRRKTTKVVDLGLQEFIGLPCFWWDGLWKHATVVEACSSIDKVSI